MEIRFVDDIVYFFTANSSLLGTHLLSIHLRVQQQEWKLPDKLILSIIMNDICGVQWYGVNWAK